MYDVAIIGGGLAGLVNAILLKKAGLSIILFEEKSYPFHRVCGEYISNEVVPFLRTHDLFPDELEPAIISKFHLTSVSGKSLKMDLDLGGFGISRYAYDAWLAQKALLVGVTVHEKERVLDFKFENEAFDLKTSKGNYKAKLVIGSFGKRTKLDKELGRKFIQKSSPYLGVKYHVKTSLVEEDMIELHNFSGGYCGISRIENDTFNLCYLSHRDNMKAHKELKKMEEVILFRNPFLKRIFKESEFLFDKPEVINEISFKRKEPVFKHVLMSGDSAGMITPLCGNGMAMAIHSSKLLSDLIRRYFEGDMDRQQLEEVYTTEWRENFATRHWTGRKIQALFGSASASEFGVGIGKTIKPVAKYLMSKTHGKPF